MIIINDPKIAFELLRDRSAIHSSRPYQVFSNDVVGLKNATAVAPYGDYWRMQRKIMTKVTTSDASLAVFDRIQEEEAAHFLRNVLATPDEIFDHIQKETGSVILKITYGYTPENHRRDPLVDLAEKLLKAFSESAVPGKWLVDTFPVCKS